MMRVILGMERNKTIPVDSHVQEDFMTEDDGMYFSSFSDLKSDIIMRFYFGRYEEIEIQNSGVSSEFYKFYAKIKGFGVRKNDSHKSRIDGHPTSRIYKCSAKGLWAQKHIDNPDRVRKPKPLTRCLCEAEMHFKWIRDLDYWIVTKFQTKQTHLLAKPSDILYIRLEFCLKLLFL